ncbi:MAG: TP0733 family outer membrane beta-barrel protein [Spirochaetota bacterium]
MKLQKIAVVFLLLCLAAAPLASQNGESSSPSYRFDQGDQLYYFNAGPMIPLFIWLPYDESEGPISTGTMKVGGNASMGFEAFLDRNLSLGGEIGYSFSYAISNRLFTSVPLLAHINYYPVSGKIDIPLTLGIGAAYTKFDDKSFLGPVIRPEVGFIWNFSENWGLGTDISYWFYYEPKTGANADQTAFNNLLTVKLSLQYKQ